jgi:hypothetical protein
MAAYTTTNLPIPAFTMSRTSVRQHSRRRQITHQAGRALEILGHAIEYLADEFVEQGCSFSADKGQLDAVQLLMALNRQVYFECPEVPSLGERFRALLRLAPARP